MGSGTSVSNAVIVFRFICFITIGILVYYIIRQVYLNVWETSCLQKSTFDGNVYRVKNTNNKQTKADRIAQIRSKGTELVNKLYNNQVPEKWKEECKRRRKTINTLYKRWNSLKMREVSAIDTTAAYTVNKSEEMRICVTKKGSNDFENFNTSLFVLIHEMAHVCSESWGHGEEWQDNFDFLLHVASDLGIYNPEFFSDNPVNYCGTDVTTTPCDGETSKFGVCTKNN